VINLYYLLKKLRLTEQRASATCAHDCQAVTRCLHFIARRAHDWYSICLKIQSMTLKEPRNV